MKLPLSRIAEFLGASGEFDHTGTGAGIFD